MHHFRNLTLPLLAAALLPGCIDASPDVDGAPDDARGKADAPSLSADPEDRSCGGYPKLQVETAPGTCVGLVHQWTDPTFRPRSIAPVPGRTGEFLVTDFRQWSVDGGRVFHLTTDGTLKGTELKVAIEGLNLPHAIHPGPAPAGMDGTWFYLGEADRISCFSMRDLEWGPIRRGDLDVVVDGLPPLEIPGIGHNYHPITEFTFDAAWNLYVNVGALEDHCQRYEGELCLEATPGNAEYSAHVRRYAYDASRSRWSPDWESVADGLRNSMGLAFNPDGDLLLQVENGRDFEEGDRPFEELNVIDVQAALEGNARHYGWPYCYDFTATSPEWRDYDGFSCAPAEGNPYQEPWVLLPPHGAPLGLMYYTGSMFPGLKDHLLVPLHGYRFPGHRILAFPVDARGLPEVGATDAVYWQDNAGGPGWIARPYESDGEVLRRAQHVELVRGWYASEGVRPQGAPVSMTEATDGSIWFVDDKNGAILRIASYEGETDPPAPRPDLASAYADVVGASEPLEAQWRRVVDEVLASDHCAGCHDNYHLEDGAETLPELRYVFSLSGWITPGDPAESLLVTKLDAGGSMPPSSNETASDGITWSERRETALPNIEAFVRALPVPERLWHAGDWGAGVRYLGPDGQVVAEHCAIVPPGTHVAVREPRVESGGKSYFRLPAEDIAGHLEGNTCPERDAYYLPSYAFTPFLPEG